MINSNEICELLRNAIDHNSNSEYHLGFTAREIHRKALQHIVLLDQHYRTLKEMQSKYNYMSGWGKGKDE